MLWEIWAGGGYARVWGWRMLLDVGKFDVDGTPRFVLGRRPHQFNTRTRFVRSSCVEHDITVYHIIQHDLTKRQDDKVTLQILFGNFSGHSNPLRDSPRRLDADQNSGI
jgi:hypothetical protein